MTGTCTVSSFAASARSTSNPSIEGMLRSSRTVATSSVHTSSSASAPECAWRNSIVSSRSRAFSSRCTSGESSTMSTIGFDAG
ncbi:MAG: hypothetical protein RJP98_10580 [Phycisphaerales bacterium]|jgi:hypothetical protein